MCYIIVIYCYQYNLQNSYWTSLIIRF